MNELFSRLDQGYFKICLYLGVTIVLAYGGCLMLNAVSPVFATVWNLISAVVEPIIYGAALSYVIHPLVRRVAGALRRSNGAKPDFDERYNHYVAVIISLLLVAAFIILIVLIFVLMITHGISGLSVAGVQQLLGTAQGDLLEMFTAAEARLREWGLISGGSDAGLMNLVNGLSSAGSTVIFAVVFGVYFLFDGERITGYFARVVRVVLGGRNVDAGPLIDDADHVFSGYFRGQGIDALVVGISSGIVLTIIGVPYGPVVGLLAGLGNLIPYVGGPVGFASIVLMCLPNADWGRMVAGLIAMAVIMFVDANVINPRLLSDNVEVHPVLVVAALIAGGVIGGLAGMLVAVPTAALLKIQLDRWLSAREAEEVAAQASNEMPSEVVSEEAGTD